MCESSGHEGCCCLRLLGGGGGGVLGGEGVELVERRNGSGSW